jgi:hypothetical protein
MHKSLKHGTPRFDFPIILKQLAPSQNNHNSPMILSKKFGRKVMRAIRYVCSPSVKNIQQSSGKVFR